MAIIHGELTFTMHWGTKYAEKDRWIIHLSEPFDGVTQHQFTLQYGRKLLVEFIDKILKEGYRCVK